MYIFQLVNGINLIRLRKDKIMEQIVTISNVNTDEFFFSTDHCQPHNLGECWISCSIRLPMWIVPRENFEDGWIRTKEDYLRFLIHSS